MIIPRPAELGTAECKEVKLVGDEGAFHASGENSAMLDFARFDILDFTDCNVLLKWSGTANTMRDRRTADLRARCRRRIPQAGVSDRVRSADRLPPRRATRAVHLHPSS
jgi:hypothetical protein